MPFKQWTIQIKWTYTYKNMHIQTDHPNPTNSVKLKWVEISSQWIDVTCYVCDVTERKKKILILALNLLDRKKTFSIRRVFLLCLNGNKIDQKWCQKWKYRMMWCCLICPFTNRTVVHSYHCKHFIYISKHLTYKWATNKEFIYRMRPYTDISIHTGPHNMFSQWSFLLDNNNIIMILPYLKQIEK